MSQGFTLIELMVVICIVAIAIAAALPRIWEWQRSARIGHLNYARGAVHSSSTLIHAKLLSRNGTPDTAPCAGGGVADNRLDGTGSVCTEHGLVQTRHGYPAAIAPTGQGMPGIVAAAGIGTNFNATAAQLRAEGYAASVANGTMTIERADAPRPAECRFTYTEPLVARTAASISSPVISGC
jgi:MSHA pilin protein MshA